VNLDFEKRPRLDLQTPGEIHLWQICLRQSFSTVKNLFDSLSPDERERAGKYRFRKDRERFIVTRGAVREILSGYLAIAPDRIGFSYNGFGKPFLKNETRGEGVFFNVSASREIALCAVARGSEIGVDIEFIGDEPASPEVVERFFSPREAESIAALGGKRQTSAFFHCWTRKEAFIKGVGVGLTYPLKNFSVPVGEEKMNDFSIADPFRKTRRWSLTTVYPSSEYVAALAVEFVKPTIKFRQWQSRTQTADCLNHF
jgi:4'-phosphopantetheinyl transferase